MSQQGPNGEVNGFDVIVQVQHPHGVGSYITVGSQRGVTFGENNATVDMSSKERREWVGVAGRYTTTVTFTHLYIPNASGYAALKTAMRDGSYIRVKRKEFTTDIEYADCIVTGLSSDFPDQDAGVISIDLQASGPWSVAV